MLLILAPVAVLMLLTWPVTFPPNRERPNKISRTRVDIVVLCAALRVFKEDTGRYPTTQEGLHALVQEPDGIKGWHGPYIDREIRMDPWGNPYVYICPGKHNPDGYDLHSFGPSGKDGAEDNIDNWTGR